MSTCTSLCTHNYVSPFESVHPVSAAPLIYYLPFILVITAAAEAKPLPNLCVCAFWMRSRLSTLQRSPSAEQQLCNYSRCYPSLWVCMDLLARAHPWACMWAREACRKGLTCTSRAYVACWGGNSVVVARSVQMTTFRQPIIIGGCRVSRLLAGSLFSAWHVIILNAPELCLPTLWHLFLLRKTPWHSPSSAHEPRQTDRRSRLWMKCHVAS